MRRSLCILTLSLASAGGLRAAAVPAGIVPPNAPKSVFVHEPGFGRDPFHPNSRKLVVVTPSDTDTRPANLDFLSLKGISIIAGRKLAIINNSTVAEGEEFSLKNGAQVTKVKCIEIKDRLVVIQVNGVTKELPLRPGIN